MLVIAGICAVILNFSSNIQWFEEQSQRYLVEISTQINTSLVKEIPYNDSILESLAMKLRQTQDWSEEVILGNLTHEASIFDYQQISLIDRDGPWST